MVERILPFFQRGDKGAARARLPKAWPDDLVLCRLSSSSGYFSAAPYVLAPQRARFAIGRYEKRKNCEEAEAKKILGAARQGQCLPALNLFY